MSNPYGINLNSFEGRHASVARLRRLFEFDHLPEHLAAVSSTFALAALRLLDQCPDSPELTEALRKLWEAKNLAVVSVARPESERGHKTKLARAAQCGDLMDHNPHEFTAIGERWGRDRGRKLACPGRPFE